MRKRAIDIVMDILFIIALAICIVGLSFSLYVFITSAVSIRSSFSGMVADILNSLKSTDDSVSPEIEKMMSNASKLQELQSNAVSTNILTFLYTFLSGVLIGVATFFTKKNYDSLKQIMANKAQLDNHGWELIHATLYQKVIYINSTFHLFYLSLNSPIDGENRKAYLEGFVPMLNTSVDEMNQCFFSNEKIINEMQSEKKKQLRTAVQNMAHTVETLLVDSRVTQDAVLKPAVLDWQTSIRCINACFSSDPKKRKK